MSEELLRFGIRDQYFSYLNETKIWRLSFLLRTISSILFSMLLLILFFTIIKYWIPLLSNPEDISWIWTRIKLVFVMMPVPYLVLLTFLLLTIPVLVHKRCEDIDWWRYVLYWIILWSILVNMLFWTNVIFLAIAWNMLALPVIKLLWQLQSITQFLGWVGFIISILIIIYLSLRPGIKNTENILPM